LKLQQNTPRHFDDKYFGSRTAPSGIRKFALVIGNGGYSGGFKLDSPPLDAAAMELSLANLGFDVTWDIDLTSEKMNRIVGDFCAKVKDAATKADTLLFYFSGHGIARLRQNYIVPIDFDSSGSLSAKFIRVKSVIDELSSITKDDSIKIILLDACRSGDTDDDLARYNEQMNTAVKKSVIVSATDMVSLGEAPVTSKFTMMTGGQNTFIAFATAEWRIAYGTRGVSLSLFTDALLDNINSVDLPLTNLLNRVRIKVSNLINEEQNTCDQSSLEQPFFFNPGSLLMFNENAMALVGLLLSFIPYSLLLTTNKS
jgi:uncharacterized caspase-like protein